MTKTPKINDPIDPWDRILAAAARIEAELHHLGEITAKFVADYEADKAIEDAQRRAEQERQMRQGLQSPYLARGFLANQQPRLDGDNRPWEPRKGG